MSKKPDPTAHKLLVDPEVMGTAAAEPWALALFPGVSGGDVVRQIRQVTDRVKAGDLSDIEAMLVSQAMALQTVFTALTRQAGKQEFIPNLQAVTGLALKTQSACRQTLEALVELKQPRPVVYGQANIAQQQVVHQAPHHTLNTGMGGPRPSEVDAGRRAIAQGEAASLATVASERPAEHIPRKGD